MPAGSDPQIQTDDVHALPVDDCLSTELLSARSLHDVQHVRAVSQVPVRTGKS